jgi:hypothetical protein
MTYDAMFDGCFGLCMALLATKINGYKPMAVNLEKPTVSHPQSSFEDSVEPGEPKNPGMIPSGKLT